MTNIQENLRNLRLRGAALHEEIEQENYARIDRMFAFLMILQWISGVAIVMFVSPYTWIGARSLIHTHFWAATILGGLISSAPVVLGIWHPGKAITRHTIAASQAFWGALLIHLTGGRIETHFHIFVSLAFMAFYRDWKVLITMSLVVAIDHAFRGIYFPLSVYGILLESPYRWLEHAAWVVFEDIVLVMACLRGKADSKAVADKQAELELNNLLVEQKVRERSVELQEAKSFLQAVFDSISDHICVLDDEGEILEVNAVWDKFGNAKHQKQLKIGSNYIKFCEEFENSRPIDGPSIAETFREVLAKDQTCRIERYAFESETATIWYHINISPLSHDHQGAVVIAHSNITDQVEAEQKLRETKEHFELLSLVAKYTDNAVIITDPDGKIEWVNAGFTRITGYQLEDVWGHAPIEILQGPETNPEAVAFIKKRFLEKKGFDIEVLKYRKTGETYWSSIETRPIFNELGAVVKFIGIESDITEKRKQEKEKRKLANQLQDAARQAGMAEVATGLLHNVGNVLNSVNISASQLENSLHSSPIRHLQKISDVVDEHDECLAEFFTHGKGKNLPKLLQNLVDHFKKDRTLQLDELQQLTANIDHIKEIVAMQQSFAKKQAIPEPIKPVDLFDDAVKMLGESLTRHSVTVNRMFDFIPEIYLPRHDVIQILLNLIKNAQQAMDDLENQEKAIHLTLTSHNGFVEFHVDDEGEGIPSDQLNRIFQHGFTTKPDGHGFGLHASANTAHELGGSLTASNEGQGRGASFKLALPMKVKSEQVIV